MNQKRRSIRYGFTLIELMVVIAIIGILAALLTPAVQKAMNTGHLMQAVNNASEIQKATLAAALDASTNGTYSVTWPGDMTTPPSDMVGFANALHNGGYMSDFKILTADGIPPAGVNVTSHNIAFSFGLVNSTSPDNVAFITSKNFNPVGVVPRDPLAANTSVSTTTTPSSAESGSTENPSPISTVSTPTGAVNPGAKPFGNKGFVVVRKAGDAGSYQRPTDAYEQQGPPGTFVWGLDPSRATPPVPWIPTPP